MPLRPGAPEDAVGVAADQVLVHVERDGAVLDLLRHVPGPDLAARHRHVAAEGAVLGRCECDRAGHRLEALGVAEIESERALLRELPVVALEVRLDAAELLRSGRVELVADLIVQSHVVAVVVAFLLREPPRVFGQRFGRRSARARPSSCGSGTARGTASSSRARASAGRCRAASSDMAPKSMDPSNVKRILRTVMSAMSSLRRAGAYGCAERLGPFAPLVRGRPASRDSACVERPRDDDPSTPNGLSFSALGAGRRARRPAAARLSGRRALVSPAAAGARRRPDSAAVAPTLRGYEPVVAAGGRRLPHRAHGGGRRGLDRRSRAGARAPGGPRLGRRDRLRRRRAGARSGCTR